MNNFEALSDFDFEQLMADLLSAEWEAPVEYFPRGRDGGVDLRVLGPTSGHLALSEGEELIAQCKHRPLAAYKDIESELKKEAKRPIVEQSARYVLATSARLTRANKREIAALFKSNLHERDIYARDDIARLLRKHPNVEKSHVKLWLSSGTVLPILIHQMENLRSQALREELQRLKNTFVETRYFRNAMSMIDSRGVCILAGPPGVGKTTTAHLLLLRLMAQGWEPIAGVADVRELEAQIVPGARQVLFLDDFLGQNSLESKLKVGGDTELVRLIHAVEQDTTKTFLLTTREYILKQAQQSYEKLGDDLFNVTKVSVTSQGLSLHERVHILYNQLYYSPLRTIAAQGDPHLYVAIAQQRAFNPRLTSRAISALSHELGLTPGRSIVADVSQAPTQPRSPEQRGEVDVPARLARAVRDPEHLWDHAIRNQLTSLQRKMLFTRATFGQDPVALDDLYAATVGYCSVGGHSPSRMDLDAAAKVLDGDCFALDTYGARRDIYAGSLDPGIADAVNIFLGKYDDIIGELIQACQSMTQVRWIAALLGVTGYDKSTRGSSMPPKLARQLLDATERTLLSPSPTTARIRSSWVPKRQYEHIGQDLTLVMNLLRVANLSAPPFYATTIADMSTKIGRVPIAEIEKTIRFLESEVVPTDWRSLKTKIEHNTLMEFGDPRDVEEWEAIADILDFINPAAEFKENLKNEFEMFAMDRLEEMRDQLEDDLDSADTEDLQKLESIAEGLGVSINTYEVEELLERREESAKEPAPEPRRKLDYGGRRPGTSAIAPRDLFDLL